MDPQARERLYHFLAAAFLRPLTPEALHQLTNPEVLNELAQMFGEEAIAALRDHAATSPGEAAAQSLQQEFMDLFAVPGGRYVTPFEDVYRGASPERKLGPLLGEHAVAVRRLYRAAGGEVEAHCKELPTHIGVELAFMSFLCAKEAAARCDDADASPSSEADASRSEEDAQRQGCATERYRALQGMFLREHLNAWFPRLNRAIQEQAASGLYRGLAELTEAVLERDAAWLLSEPPSGVAASTAVH
jgi:TorA maturation chaperone TorD